MRLAKVELDRSKAVRGFGPRLVGWAVHILAMGMGNEGSRPDRMEVVGEPSPSNDIEVLVGVLGELPAPAGRSAVVLPIPGPDLDGQRDARAFDGELAGGVPGACRRCP